MPKSNKPRIQIVGRPAKKFGKHGGFSGGYKVIEYHPNFGGRTEHERFMKKSDATKFAKKLME